MGNTVSGLPEPLAQKVPAPREVPAVGTPNINPDFAVPMAAPGVTVFDKSKQVAQADPNLNKVDKYERFREEMFAYMLGEAAYDYAEKLYSTHPDDPDVMAFLSDTIWRYEKKKVERKRAHWLDRMSILQRGLDVSRKCIETHPDFFPCYRNYTIIACRMADQKYFWRWMRAIGSVECYDGIMKRGLQTLDMRLDFDVAMSLAALNGRAATWWYSPYRPFGLWYGIPDRDTTLRRALYLHQIAHKANPNSLENCCRLGMTHFELNQLNEARKWYIRVRDAMIPPSPDEEFWQSIAHTHLSMRFQKTRWNAGMG
jgi:hypothetical protein